MPAVHHRNLLPAASEQHQPAAVVSRDHLLSLLPSSPEETNEITTMMYQEDAASMLELLYGDIL